MTTTTTLIGKNSRRPERANAYQRVQRRHKLQLCWI